MDMKFPIIFKHKRIFVWYSGRWINIHLGAAASGDGIRGYYLFFKGWLKCVLGKHTYIHIFRMKTFTSHKQCSYCRKEKYESD